MKRDPFPCVYYKRSRFKTRLPADRSYLPSHYWLLEEQPGVWRIGFTRFALRMMGDLVDCNFTAPARGPIETGQPIGTVEGLKAISEIYSIVHGEFLGGNPDMDRDPSLVDRDPYREGWLYRAQGAPDPNHCDVHGYVAVLDATIDKMLRQRHQGSGE